MSYTTMRNEPDERAFDALSMLQEACARHGVNLAVLVAETAVWANPEVHRRLVAANGTGAFFPGLRRARVGAGENRGATPEGGRLDDNTGANQAIKKAIGMSSSKGKVKGFEACHIWPGTTYDERYHTVIANLVLLPRALAGLSDHDPRTQAVLQYRAFALYNWFPAEASEPSRPEDHPSCWREPEPFTPAIALTIAKRYSNAAVPKLSAIIEQTAGTPLTLQSSVPVALTPGASDMPSDEFREVISKLRMWAVKPQTKVHRILGLVTRAHTPYSRRGLAEAVERLTGSSDGYGAVASLLTSKGNAYGRVFQEVDGRILIHPAVAEEVAKHRWT